MRKCDNCMNSCYAFDCNCGKETLYCKETGYEYEVQPEGVCELHQFVPGYEEEKHYLVYDENYLGPGYFIIKETNGEITDFLKLYIINNHTIPQYGLRAFSCAGRKSIDNGFKSIEFIFRDYEDLDNGLFEMFANLSVDLQGETQITDKNQSNNISLLMNDENVRLVVSTNAEMVEGECEFNLFGEKEEIGYIDIKLGNNPTSYLAIEKLFTTLSNLNPPVINNQDIQKIIKLKVNN